MIGLIVAVLALAAILMVLAVNRIQTALLERDAISMGVRWTNGIVAHLESIVPVLQGKSLSEADRRTIALASRLGGLRDFVIFDQNGRAVASSNAEEVGRVNTSAYWADQVLRGEPHAAIEILPADGAVEPVIVAETYLPVFSRGAGSDNGTGGKTGTVIGAFEAYLDVSASARAYRRIGLYMSVVGVALILFSGGIAIAFVWRNAAYRSERENSLALARRAAEASNAAKSSFLATMSHEIRTPMSGVLATLELLERTPLNAGQRDMLTVIRRSAGALLELLNQILDLSKIEAGKFDLSIAPFSLAEMAGQAVAVLRPAASRKSISLDLVIARDLPDVVCGDEARLRQILLNLVGNAIKFTESGKVTVSLQPDKAVKDGISISVTDTGLGMERADLDRLFKPFEQADSSTTRRFGGTGLGLAITRQLADLMGGHISVTSTPGRGSAFRLVLPLPESSEAAASAAQDIFETPQLSLSVLVADDDETNRWVMGRQLEQFGCSATIVENGAEALERWRQNPGKWDVLITDWHMPELDGLGLLRALRAEALAARAEARLLIMTAAGLPEDVALARDAGADEVLIKPVSLRVLARALAPGSGGDVFGSGELPDREAALPDPAVLDTRDLAEMCGGDQSMLEQALSRFAVRLEESLKLLQVGAKPADIAGEAHKLKGAAAAVGAVRLAAAAGELETLFRRNGGTPDPEDFASLQQEAQTLRKALAAYRTNEGKAET